MNTTLEAPHGRARWVALVVLCTGMLMIVLDATIVSVALPSIQSDLGFSQSSLAWVVNAYLIAFGGLLLLAGRLGDLISRRGVFLTGLAVFTGASLVCGVAHTQGLLVGARFVQGVGGAMTSSVILGMIVTMFPEPREQAKAIGVYAFVASAGGSIGLLVGGVLTQAINWHWIFFVNLPIGVVTAVMALRVLDGDRGIGLRRGADVAGAVLITASLMIVVYTIVKPAAEYGWGAGRTLAFGAVSLVLLVAFLVREAAASSPLIPLRIFRSRNVSGANLIQALTVAGMFGLFFLGALYLRRVVGYDALQLGFAFLPTTVIMGTFSIGPRGPQWRLSRRVPDRGGAGRGRDRDCGRRPRPAGEGRGSRAERDARVLAVNMTWSPAAHAPQARRRMRRRRGRACAPPFRMSAQRPRHSGARFSPNARTPSRKSLEEKQARRSSISSCSSSGSSAACASSTARITRLLPSCASGALAAISLASSSASSARRSGSATKLTSPQARAVRTSICRPTRNSSRVRAAPIVSRNFRIPVWE